MSRLDVKTEGRFVQWEVGYLECYTESNPFITGIWRWYCPTLLFSTFQNSGGDPVSIWTSYTMKLSPEQATSSGFACMLQEGILTDIAINTADGSIRVHSAVLAARSPVFRSMFSHNLKEKQLSAVDISDMSFDECQAFVNYMYDNLHEKEFTAHRLALLGAADKYDVPGLKVICLDSLLQDIETENLIERLEVAHLYQLSELKRSCIRLLVDFRKLYEIHDDFNEFIKTADKDLVVEILQYVYEETF
ncbi:BTB/POZ domain-containing protein At1g55760-like [Phragmites australis]|uniref:BTB/POZ domain-containing protein At1g55760-like n=1 Tax=Phragmites australis TaxID=29695 RepID=UPI002D7800E7|nr:BTB/POZ domain-containing protein At1g55760-like [Phragmites australis]